MAIINGTELTDILNGTSEDDQIYGYGNADKLFGLGGNDLIDAGNGSDEVEGGDGNDSIFGGDGNDQLHGNDGNDSLHGGNGTDSIWGDSGDDIVYGGADFDAIIGGFGNDTLYGEDGDDILHGEDGNDIILGGMGNDLLYGNNGNDILDGGEGVDRVIFLATNFNEATIRHAKTGGYLVTTPNEGIDTIINIEIVRFSAGVRVDIDPSDYTSIIARPNYSTGSGSVTSALYSGPVTFLEFQYIGSTADETVTASAQNDFLNLLGGSDAANGGLGDDVLDGGTGSNFLTGGGDNDTFFLDGRGGTVTWSTITDFVSATGAAGDEVNIWGWVAGTSQLLLSQENGGVAGFTGATYHYDLNGDNTIDTSITFTGLTLAQVPTAQALSVAGNGYLLLG